MAAQDPERVLLMAGKPPGVLCFHLSVTKMKKNQTHLHPKRQSLKEAVQVLHQKRKKQQGMFVCTKVGTYTTISCSMGCLIANWRLVIRDKHEAAAIKNLVLLDDIIILTAIAAHSERSTRSVLTAFTCFG